MILPTLILLILLNYVSTYDLDTASVDNIGGAKLLI